MTDTQIYDGNGKLSDAIAKLCGCSPKSNNRVAELIKQAKAELGIASKSKKLPDDVKLAIYQWHYNRLHTVQIFSQAAQPDDVEIFSQADNREDVEIISRNNECKPVEIISQIDSKESVKINSQTSNDAVNLFSQYPDTVPVRIAFNIQRQGKQHRQVIALHGFYINALMLATGITKADVPKWVQAAVNSWAAFDVDLPITLQVKLLLIRELTKAIET